MATTSRGTAHAVAFNVCTNSVEGFDGLLAVPSLPPFVAGALICLGLLHKLSAQPQHPNGY